jgi:hypothetical protein
MGGSLSETTAAERPRARRGEAEARAPARAAREDQAASF